MRGWVIRRRQLARRLRQLREEAGLSLDVAAPQLDWSTSALSRIETGQVILDVHRVRSMLDLYGVGGEQWTELIDVTRTVRLRGWWREYGLDDKGYVPLETEAASVRTFQTMVVPGLLQTEEYTRALFAVPQSDRVVAKPEDEVAVRQIRQRRLTAETDALELVAVVDESVLRRAVGTPAVMAAQLRHLVVAAALPGVSLQVLPLRYAGVGSAFTILGFGDLGEPDVLYVEHVGGALHMEKEREVTRARMVFDRLRSAALSPADSVPVIERAGERGTDRED